MENVHGGTAVAHDEHSFDKKAIWRTFRILLVITVVELILAIGYYEMKFSNRELVKHVLNGIFAILTLAKAFFIIAEFMHLRHEIRNFVMTVAIPACLFIWFVIAFLWDGGSFKDLRNNYDRYHVEQSKTPAKVAPEGKEPEAKKPGSAE